MRIMVLTDGKRIPVTEKEEISIVGDLDNGSSDRVQIKGVPYKKTFIAYFDDPSREELESGRILDVWPNSKVQILTNGKRCKAEYSIQREINAIARDEGGKGWARLVTDAKWREEMRLALRSTPAKWCDYRANECACE